MDRGKCRTAAYPIRSTRMIISQVIYSTGTRPKVFATSMTLLLASSGSAATSNECSTSTSTFITVGFVGVARFYSNNKYFCLQATALKMHSHTPNVCSHCLSISIVLDFFPAAAP